MSLLSSIFGESPVSPATSSLADNLFGPKVPEESPASRESYAETGVGEEGRSGAAYGEVVRSAAAGGGEGGPFRPAPASRQVASVRDDARDDVGKSERRKTKEQMEEEESRTVFVGNLPPETDRRSLAGMFRPCGRVVSARLRSVAVTGVKLPPEHAGNQNMMRKVCANTGKMQSDTPRKSSQGYVLFESVASAERALGMNGTARGSRTIRVDRASPTVEPSRSVFVGNLPYGADEETLRGHFSDRLGPAEDPNEGGAVEGVRIVRDRETHRCRGFGYVALRSAVLVPTALRLLHGTTYMKRELRVMVCGRRLKGGGEGGGSDDGSRKWPFKGRSTAALPSASGGAPKKRIMDGGTQGAGGKMKRRRARSEKKAAPGPSSKSGLSKRAVTEQRVNKRAKKLERRASRGMGRKKK